MITNLPCRAIILLFATEKQNNQEHVFNLTITSKSICIFQGLHRKEARKTNNIHYICGLKRVSILRLCVLRGLVKM